MSRHTITAHRSGHTNGMEWEATYEVTFEFRKGAPARGPSYSDGGLPADPHEIEAVDIKPEYGSLDGREKAEALEWANDWLQGDWFDAALEIVAADDDRAREYAAELRGESNPSRRQP